MTLVQNWRGPDSVRWALPTIPERERGSQGSQMRLQIHDGLSVILDLEAQMDARAVGEHCDHRSVVGMDADTYPAEAAVPYQARVAMIGGLGGAVHVRHRVSLRRQSNRIDLHPVAVPACCEGEDRLREQVRKLELERTRG